MRTGLWRNSFNLFPGNSSNGTRAPRPTACRSIAGVLAALLAGAGGAGAIEPVAPSAEPVPSASSDVVILAGDYSIGDIMHFPWLVPVHALKAPPLVGRERVLAWFERVAERPAVQRGMAVPG